MSQGSFKVGSGGSKKCWKRTGVEEYEEEGELMLAAAPASSIRRLPCLPVTQESFELVLLTALSCSHRPPKDAAIPTYEETMYYPLAEDPLQFPGQPEEDLQCHTPGDARLVSASFSRPPSYKSILLAQGPISGSSAAGSSPS